MTKRIEVTTYRHAHYHAGCYSCGFSASVDSRGTTPEDVRREVRKHVLKTGHKCWIEKGIASHYSLVED
jgi:hypothetical protein